MAKKLNAEAQRMQRSIEEKLIFFFSEILRSLRLCVFPVALLFNHNLIAAAAERVSEIEGDVKFVQPFADGRLELELAAGTNHFFLTVTNSGGNAPVLASRIRVPGNSLANAAIANLDAIQFLTGSARPLATDVAALRRLGFTNQRAWCVAHLAGQVLAAGADSFVFQDDTGIALLKTQVRSHPVAPGQKIILDGNCFVDGERILFDDPPVVENDSLHNLTEKSGAIFLNAGKHPVRLGWFNAKMPLGLEVYLQGPDWPRQKIPDSILFRPVRNLTNSTAEWLNGLDYGSYEGIWLRVPDFDRLLPIQKGSVANFDTGVRSRDENVGLRFTGYVEVPRAGSYTFSIISDDGSWLFVDEKPPVIIVTGTNALPVPQRVVAHENVRADDGDRWAQVEGKVTFVGEKNGGLELELSSDTGRMLVEVADDSGGSLPAFLNHRVRAIGICLATRAGDGQAITGHLLTTGLDQIELLAAPVDNARAGTEALPLLTTVEQIKRLTRDEWQRSYPVKIRGVVTAVLDSGFFIQDLTRSIYVRWWPPNGQADPQVGDFWEVEGTTFAEFAPNILASRATRLGDGVMPEPLRPTWDQLINGSLDTEYVEVTGIITATQTNTVTLLTTGGKLILLLPELSPEKLAACENALVRVRGGIMPIRDESDRQFVPGQLRLINAVIAVESPAPSDPLTAPLKHVADLLAFDARAGALARVKIAGQITGERDGQFFMMDGTSGLRFLPKSTNELQVGDLVEVVGFPELGGPSPILREAIVHRSSATPLPKAVPLPPGAWLDQKYDATRVHLRARLVSISHAPAEQVLEAEVGTRGFIARLRNKDGLFPAIPPGSLLELTGVYAAQGGDLTAGHGIDAFELLLNSAADVQVLAHPSWWDLRHTLTVLGGMAAVIFAALIWIALLRRKVEERSQQLAAEIQRREQTEHQRELEAERTRIARDLHDDLGATLTQIRFLSVLESRDAQLPETTRQRLGRVSEKSCEMVASLDEIVWAVNPANDSLPNVANYLCHFAEEFFRPTAIRCRMDVADALPPAPLTSEVRHNLYLAVREALNNIAKHSHATEAWLRIHYAPPGKLRVSIEDNGRGFAPTSGPPTGNGLTNLRQRLEKIGGHFEFETRPGAGVICRLDLPVTIARSDNFTK